MRHNYFSQNLKTYREENKLTQQQLAKKLNIHANTIGSYEHNISEPSLSVLIGLSKLSGLSIDDLVFTEFEKED